MSNRKNDKLSLLEAMGVRVWLPRTKDQADKPRPKPNTVTRRQQSAATTPAIVSQQVHRSVSSPAQDRASTSVASQTHSEKPSVVADVSNFDWKALAATVSGCRSCDLHRGRTQTVFGTGSRDARWMIIGEAPGVEEDRQGEPFVGRAGQLLNSMLQAAGFQRRDVYIANIVKCRPPDNRDPRPEEAASCSAYLDRQIALVKPQIILAVGRVAAQTLLKNDTAVGRMRGKLHHYGSDPGVPVVVTYHPAYLLRAPKEKRKAWQDLLFALEQSEVAT